MILLLLFASPFTTPAVEIDAIEELREPWRAACESIARALPGPGTWRVTVRRAETMEEFVERTGRARFEAAALAGDVIWMQAKPVLDRFGDLEPILRHECVHARLRFLGVPPLPRVVEEAVALGIAGQASRLPRAEPLGKEELLAAEKILAAPRDRAIFERTLARAYATVWPKWRENGVDWLRALAREGTWVDRL